MKGNGLPITNDRLTFLGDSPQPAPNPQPFRTLDDGSLPGPYGYEEIYPTLGGYSFVKRVHSSWILFDAVSDQILKINPGVRPLLERCDGLHNLATLIRIGDETGLEIPPSELYAFFEKLRDLKVVDFHIHRKKQNARVLLINPNQPFPRSRYAYQHIYPPLGLLYLAGQLLAAGFETEILDMTVDDMQAADIGPWLASCDEPWDLIGISLNMTCSAERATRLAGNLRDLLPDTPIIMGGNHATMTYEELLSTGVCDFVCLGPGDHLITSLCESLFRKTGPIDQIPGLAYARHGEVMQTCPVQPTKIIKDIEFPAYHLIDLDRYDIGGRIPVITSTGCPYDCKYCSTVKFNGRRVSYLPVERVVEDIKRLMKVYNCNGFNFMDDSFTFNRKRMIAICELIMEEGLEISWTCNTRVDMVDRDLLFFMSKAGCAGIFYGIESMDQAVLNRMHKKVKVEQVRNAVEWAREAGIKVRQSYIVGLPGETVDSLRSVTQFINETKPDEVQLSMLTIYPGTDLADDPDRFGLEIHPLRWDEHNINVPHVSTDTMTSEEIFDAYLEMRIQLTELGQ